MCRCINYLSKLWILIQSKSPRCEHLQKIEFGLFVHHLASIEWIVFQLVIESTLENTHVYVVLEHDRASKVEHTLTIHDDRLRLSLHNRF
jgi:hypothetical protein